MMLSLPESGVAGACFGAFWRLRIFTSSLMGSGVHWSIYSAYWPDRIMALVISEAVRNGTPEATTVRGPLWVSNRKSRFILASGAVLRSEEEIASESSAFWVRPNRMHPRRNVKEDLIFAHLAGNRRPAGPGAPEYRTGLTR